MSPNMPNAAVLELKKKSNTHYMSQVDSYWHNVLDMVSLSPLWI